ncbi:MAG: endonuclease domain-containing protein, partial [Acidobacteriota bacterium]
MERRRRLRREATDAESLLWRLLRGRQLAGEKFRRQHQVGPYILDYYCPSQKIAIEADGGQHLTVEGLARDA